MSALTDFFTSLSNKIRNKLNTSITYTPTEAVNAIDDVYNKGITDTKQGNATTGDVKSGITFTSTNGVNLTGTFTAQEKTVTAGTSAASVTPDSGKYLSKVTYNPTPSQTKSASPSTSAQTISPDSGKYLSSVSISAISPQRSSGTAATTSGRDSTGPYVYFPYGWWPNANSTYGNYTRLTEAQGVAVARKQEKTITGSRSAQTVTPDSNYVLSKVTVNKYPDASGTFNASTTRSTAIDMGATNNYRYVNTNSVSNTNSGTYTFAANDTGGTKDMGATNTYRYVNAGNVYNKGYSDGSSAGYNNGHNAGRISYANNRGGYGSGNNASESRFDLYDIYPNTKLTMSTTTNTLLNVTITDGNNNTIGAGNLQNGHNFSFTTSSSFSNRTLCIYIKPSNGVEQTIWYWWNVSNSNY